VFATPTDPIPRVYIDSNVTTEWNTGIALLRMIMETPDHGVDVLVSGFGSPDFVGVTPVSVETENGPGWAI